MARRDSRAVAAWKTLVHAALQGVALFAFWMLFVWSTDGWELALGVPATCLGVWAIRSVSVTHLTDFRGRPRWLLEAWRLPGYAFSGTWEIFTVLARHLFTRHKAESLLQAVHFDAGGDDPASAARRAIAITYTTITPNFIVVGIDPEDKLLLYHQIRKSPALKMTLALGASP